MAHDEAERDKLLQNGTAAALPAVSGSAATPPVEEIVNKPPAPAPDAPADKPTFSVSAEDYGDFVTALLTHPAAYFIEDVKGLDKLAPETPAKPAEKRTDPKTPEDTEPKAETSNGSPATDVEFQAGMVVSLGADAARLRSKFVAYWQQAKAAGAETGIERIKIDGKTWYRYTPPKPGDKNALTFGFHGTYFVMGTGNRAVERILARWDSPAPAWLAKAMQQTEVPRRTGIIYLDLKALRDKLLPLAPPQTDAAAVLELLGLDNVDSLVSTTGLEGDGMINRVLLAMDGKPHGLLDLVADRPLEAKDLEPIPGNAMLAVAARVDLDRALKVLAAVCEKAGVGGDIQGKGMDALKQEYDIDVRRVLSSVGDTWRLYNSPAEGEAVFLGWTAVVSIRDRGGLVAAWEDLLAAREKKKAATEGEKDKVEHAIGFFSPSAEIQKCRFAGHDIYYMAGQAIAPAVCVGDREMVVTLNMPAMKAYLARKNHRSLATLPGVALALNDRNRPAAVGYCDTPRVFELLYPYFAIYGSAGSAAAQKEKIDLGPNFWPLTAAIAPHLRPDVTTVGRTPHGLELTCRYCLPTGGANGPLYLVLTSTLGGVVKYALPLVPSISQGSQANQNRRAAEATHAGPAEEQSASPSPSPSAVRRSSPGAREPVPVRTISSRNGGTVLRRAAGPSSSKLCGTIWAGRQETRRGRNLES